MKQKPAYMTSCIVNWEVHHAINKTEEKSREMLKDLFREKEHNFRIDFDRMDPKEEHSEI